MPQFEIVVKKWVTDKEIAEFFGFTQKTLYNYKKK